jgi:tetratricopeptide (TPR) repeat protein
MNTLPTILLSVGCAVGAGIVTSVAMSPRAPAIAAGSGDVDRELALLRGEVVRLTGEVQVLRRDAETGTSVSTRLPVGDIGEAVRSYLDEHLVEYAAGAGIELVEEDKKVETPLAAEDYLAQLLDDTLDWDGREKIWERVRESGRLDEVVAMFEARAEERNSDPEAQVDLGHAYLQQIYELGDSPAAGVVAAKADSAYDRALELDERHWEARFSKSIALSFWPPIFGKQQDAIDHFEILLDQQEGGPAEDRFRQSYILLGNLYHQVGQGDNANEVWARGLTLFPDSEELRGKFASGDQ